MKKVAIKISIMILFCYIFPLVCHSQNVGINTNDPQTTLDVVGDINLRKDLKVSNLDGSKMTSGLKGQALVSRGPNLSPEWKYVEGTRTTFRIKESIVKTDEVGVIFTDQNKMDITPGFNEDVELSNSTMWKEIVGLKSDLTPTDTKNWILITMQTMCHSDNANSVDYLFSMGIFLDGKLKATRPLNLTGSDYVFESSVLYDSFANLPMKANNEPYVVQIAVCQRYRSVASGSWKVAVGTSSGTFNANSWMNKTSMKIELYEVFLD